MRRLHLPVLAILALATVLLALAPRTAYAASPWDRQVRGAQDALRKHDAVLWWNALRGLARHDHAGAVVWIGKLYAGQLAFKKAWKHGESNAGRYLLRADPHELYLAHLRDRINVRSLHALVDGVERGDDKLAALFGAAVRLSPARHRVDDLLRERLRKNLRLGKKAIAARLLRLLEGRLHVGDVPWIQPVVLDTRHDAAFRLDLLRACPADALVRATLARQAAKPCLPPDGLRTLVAAHVNDKEATLASAAAALTEAHGRAAGLRAVFLAGSDAPPRTQPFALRALEQELLREALALPALAGLAQMHRDYVRLRYARSWRRDGYLYKRAQRQRFDKRIDDDAIVAKAAATDFGDPVLVKQIALLRRVRAALARAAPDATPKLMPSPYAADLFLLNDGRRVWPDSIAFTRRERQWQDNRDEVLAYNEREPVSRDAERANALLVNRFRLAHDLTPLRIDKDLIESSRRHSAFQRAAGEIAHSFKSRREPAGQTPAQRMVKAGYPPRFVGGENVLMGTIDAEKAFIWWRDSAGHKKNMLHPAWTEIGVGRSGSFWTQNFGREPHSEDHDAEDD